MTLGGAIFLRVLRPAPAILTGLFELFEMLLVCTFIAFSDVPLSGLLDEAAPKETPALHAPRKEKSWLCFRVQCFHLMHARLTLFGLVPA